MGRIRTNLRSARRRLRALNKAMRRSNQKAEVFDYRKYYRRKLWGADDRIIYPK